jgi:prepilin-type processing-associated H-X9-DG protein
MRDLLIRYLLGELDAQEQQRVEERLQSSPDLRHELALLRTCFAAADDVDSPSADLPRGLAERTTRRVARSDYLTESCDEAALPRLSSAMIDSPPSTALGWSLADLTVAGGVFLAVSMLLFPALRGSRDATRANICQDHLRQFGVLFGTFDENEGAYPEIQPTENAGMFAVKLLEGEYCQAGELTVLLVCPGAPLADKIRAGEFAVSVPTTVRLFQMGPVARAEARQQMSPCYAYQFPYRDGNRFVYPRGAQQRLAPVLSDTSGAAPGEVMSPNHNGVMQVLFGDGSVRLLQSCLVPTYNDDLYRNARGVVAAGCSPRDFVLGRSEAMPGIEFTSHRP